MNLLEIYRLDSINGWSLPVTEGVIGIPDIAAIVGLLAMIFLLRKSAWPSNLSNYALAHHTFHQQQNPCEQSEADFTVDRIDQNENGASDIQQGRENAEQFSLAAAFIAQTQKLTDSCGERDSADSDCEQRG